jgi:hypothetical protein
MGEMESIFFVIEFRKRPESQSNKYFLHRVGIIQNYLKSASMKFCKNCGHPVHELYCPYCGQKTKPQKITFSFLSRELIHFFTHLEKGFLFTSYQMVIRPGETTKNFIDGKRKNYQSPVSYFLIWTTIFILFLYAIEKIFGADRVVRYRDYFGPSVATKLAISNLSIVLTVIIPFQALYLFLLVTKRSYNYFETMVASIYSIGTIILFQFIFALFAVSYFLIESKPVDLRISDSFKIIYLSWFILDTIRLYPLKHKFIRAISFCVLAFGTFTAWRLWGFPLFIRLFI